MHEEKLLLSLKKITQHAEAKHISKQL